jgi:hypothetical protein
LYLSIGLSILFATLLLGYDKTNTF